DAPPITASQQYFKPNNVGATQDLISIAHMSAQECGLVSSFKKPGDVFTEQELKINQQSIAEQLKAIHSKYIELEKDPRKVHPRAKAEFELVSQIVAKNHANLGDYKIESRQIPDGLFVSMTDETLQKYGYVSENGTIIHPDGGWGQVYGVKSTEFNNDNFDKSSTITYACIEGTHATLPDMKHAPLVAKQMLQYFNSVARLCKLSENKDNASIPISEIKLTNSDTSEVSVARSQHIPIPVVSHHHYSLDSKDSASSVSSDSSLQTPSPLSSVTSSPQASPRTPEIPPSPIHTKPTKYVMDLSPAPASPKNEEEPTLKRSKPMKVNSKKGSIKSKDKDNFTPPHHPRFFTHLSAAPKLKFKHLQLKSSTEANDTCQEHKQECKGFYKTRSLS
ncbi:MAG TPA: hypothetical protein VHA52_00250, partial [Candidatus Babeliaceae bacterium]|nr:hypothetical protein [Candidatus Babeliaceae bacterium]